MNDFEDTYVVDDTVNINDLEEVEVFDSLFSKESLLFIDLVYMIDVLDYTEIELGVLQQYDTEYYTFNGHCYYGPCSLIENGDVEVMVMLGENEIYADIWLFDENNDLENRSVYHIVYDEQGIVEMNMVEFDAILDDLVEKNQFKFIDYSRNDGGMILSTTDYILGLRALSLTLFDEERYTVYDYHSMGNQLDIFISDTHHQHIYTSSYDEDIDSSRFYLFEDQVFQVSYVYAYDHYYDKLLNSKIEYNIKYVQDINHYDSSYLYYYDDLDILQSIEYPYSLFHIQGPFYMPIISYSIETEINETSFKHPLGVFDFNQILYDDFISFYLGYDDIWDTFYIDESNLVIRDYTFNLGDESVNMLPEQIDLFSNFIDEINEYYPDAIY
jgi:hypothetical protein